MKLCSFNDPCGEAAVVAAARNEEEGEQRSAEQEIKNKNGCHEYSTFDISNSRPYSALTQMAK